MYPEEREYRVGPRGFRTRNDAKGDEPYVDIAYEPGALVWLRGTPPPSADLVPTGRERRYETKTARDFLTGKRYTYVSKVVEE